MRQKDKRRTRSPYLPGGDEVHEVLQLIQRTELDGNEFVVLPLRLLLEFGDQTLGVLRTHQKDAALKRAKSEITQRLPITKRGFNFLLIVENFLTRS